jgi:hypothetical protein
MLVSFGGVAVMKVMDAILRAFFRVLQLNSASPKVRTA